ncbi:MAG: c-type cytochrome, partial [Planctomyces sp.]
MRIDFCRITRTAVAISTALLLFAVPQSSAAVFDEPQQPSGDTPLTARGQQIYQERCISCHGVNGQGTPQAPAPIFGDRSLADLADLITRTMPEGSPEDCVGDDAVAVAEWMQAAFYSPEAQARLNPPRLELTRLTVQQYRNAAADLGVEFRWRQAIDAERGLNAEYFAGRGLRRD